MNKLIAFMTCAVLTATASAVEYKLTPEQEKLLATPYKQLSKEKQKESDALREKIAYVKYGGDMQMPGTPCGAVRFVNQQKRVATEKIVGLLDAFDGWGYDIKIVDKDEPDALVRVFLVDKPDAKDALVVWPDKAMAEVNIAALVDEKTDAKPAFLAARARKELLRAFSSATAGSTYGTKLFGKIAAPKELDKQALEGYPMDIMMRSTRYLDDLGAKPLAFSTYRDVLKLGYDIAPTNDVQKAIYEEISKTVKLTKRVK